MADEARTRSGWDFLVLALLCHHTVRTTMRVEDQAIFGLIDGTLAELLSQRVFEGSTIIVVRVLQLGECGEAFHE